MTLTLQNRSSVVISVPITSILPSSHQPRRNFDKAALQSLTDSIRRYGILQPLLVQSDGERYRLIAGERRLRAAALAGLRSVPCILYDKSAEDCAIATMIENLQRQNLNYWEEAEGLRALLNEFGMTQDELAEKIGKSQGAVANKLRLLRLPDSVRQLLRENNLTERHARALLRLTDSNKLYKAAATIVKRNYTVAQSEQYIAKLLADAPAPPLRTPLIRDRRLCHNTVRKAVRLMVNAGIPAVSETREQDDYIEYVIRIPRQ